MGLFWIAFGFGAVLGLCSALLRYFIPGILADVAGLVSDIRRGIPEWVAAWKQGWRAGRARS